MQMTQVKFIKQYSSWRKECIKSHDWLRVDCQEERLIKGESFICGIRCKHLVSVNESRMRCDYNVFRWCI